MDSSSLPGATSDCNSPPFALPLAFSVFSRWPPATGVGRGLLQDAILRTSTIADPAGIRAPMTHPLDDAAASFYLRFGFIPSPLRERQLLLLLKDARRLMNF
jgi:hypothetical protein